MKRENLFVSNSNDKKLKFSNFWFSNCLFSHLVLILQHLIGNVAALLMASFRVLNLEFLLKQDNFLMSKLTTFDFKKLSMKGS